MWEIYNANMSSFRKTQAICDTPPLSAMFVFERRD